MRTLPLPAGGVKLVTFLPLQWGQRGCRKEVIPPANAPQPVMNAVPQQRQQQEVTPLHRALGLAHYWQRLLDEQSVASPADIAHAEGVDVTQVRRLLRLTLLAPEIITHLVNDRQAQLEPVVRQTWPIHWDDQRRMRRHHHQLR